MTLVLVLAVALSLCWVASGVALGMHAWEVAVGAVAMLPFMAAVAVARDAARDGS